MKGDESVKLARKATEMLLLLVENAGRVVTKEEIFSTIWPDHVVDEANLAQNIALIRRALGSEQGERGLIETYSGRGYRFVAPVESVGRDPAPDAGLDQASTPSYERSRRFRGLVVFAWISAVLAVFGAVFVLRNLRPGDVESFRIVPVTRLAGKEYQPAISPDGTRVAFLWEQDAGKSAGLWVQAFDESSPRPVSSGEGEFSSPAWSPDGRSLAFIRFGESVGAIDIASAEGKGPKVLTSVFPTRHGLANRHLDWSPDGRWLAFDDEPAPNQPFAIFLISLETGERRRLTWPEALSIGDVSPRFSPDGKTISFIRVLHRASQELFTVPVTGEAARPMTSDGKQLTDQDWMPDGRTLLFASNREGEFRLYKTAIAGTGSARSYRAIGIYGEFPIQFSLSRRTHTLVYSVLQYGLNIWRLSLNAQKDPYSRWTRVIASTGQDASPQFSPDGSSICFRSDRTGEEELWASRADGSNQVQITKGGLHPSVGRWSPDGQSIVFNHARTGAIFIARHTGGDNWTVHPLGETGYHPVYSLDGESIYAGTMDAIVKIPARGGPPHEILNRHGISLGLSLDGEAIYFVHEAPESTLWKLNLDSRELVQVLDGLVPYCTSCWAVASGGIYYLGAKPRLWGRQAIYFRDFSNGNDRLVAEYPEPLPPIGSGPFSLSPDLKSILTVRVDPSGGDVVRVENFH
jgi:Tol biopolymer transport system component/DNA-binding winged helix-turn-helix (wHTH) protein